MTSPSPPPRSREDRFGALYEATYADLLRFCRRRVHPSHAEDVVSDVFLVAWRRLDEVPADHRQARPWLFGVARGTLQNSRRGQDRHRALAVRVAEAGTRGGSDDDPHLVARRLDLAAAWPLLSAAEQEVIALAAWDGLSAPEAAVVLGTTATAFRLRLSRARKALRRHADDAPGHDRRPSERTSS